ncbi:tetratricopeptide repeat protein [Prochlorococcus marinus]|uniref:tetratricopeptide repeat protein n=1 Tax=Prochlorococcus marinus TaxID=1219 RepID=UPI002FBD5FEE
MMDSSSQEKEGTKKITGVKTFSVPYNLEEIKEKITFNTNTLSKSSKEQIINKAFKFHSQGNILEAIKYYQDFINQGFNDHRVFFNYGVILKNLGKFKEAELSTRKAIEISPDFAEAHSNLGLILSDLGKFKEAELSTRKAIEISPDYAEAHSNLGVILKNLGKFKEAELSTRKAIEIKPDFANAHFNLGDTLKDLGKFKEAELSTRKAIEISPDYAEAHSNLGFILSDLGKFKEAELSLKKAIELKPDWQAYFLYAGCIFKRKAFEVVTNNLLKAKSLELENHQKAYINAALNATGLARNNLIYSKNLDIKKRSKSLINKSKNKLILNRKREDELLTYLYGVKNRELNNTVDARYGKGYCSQDLHFFDDQSPTISNLSDDLKNICKAELGLKEIIICESFFNIFKSGSSAGAKSHWHIGKRDSFFGLKFYKYSLIYYLDIGDQNGEDPGILKLYEPDEEILPTNNMLVIIGAERYHSVSYHGRKDRIVLSANFYGF